jgi:protein TonB
LTLRNFVIASLVFHVIFLSAVWFVNWKTEVEIPDKPLIAKIVPLEEIVQPPIKEAPKREETPIIKKKPPIKQPQPLTKAPRIEDKEPPQTMEGEGGSAKKGTKKSSERQIDKRAFDSENLKIAEKRAVEELLREERKESLDAEAGAEGEGGITFSTHEFKYYGYKMRLKEKIEGVWKYPPDAAEKGIYADLYIRFTILKDGKLGAIDLLRTSGYKMLDDAALKALKNAAPFWPLPGEWKEESFTITGHFIYSLSGYHLR